MSYHAMELYVYLPPPPLPLPLLLLRFLINLSTFPEISPYEGGPPQVPKEESVGIAGSKFFCSPDDLPVTQQQRKITEGIQKPETVSTLEELSTSC